MAIKQITDGGPDGTKFGQSTADLISLWGVTVTTQPTAAAQAAVATTAITTAATTTTPFGFASSTQADNLTAIAHATRALVNQLRSDLVSVGIIKGS